MCCNVLQCVTMCCNVLQCVAMCCNVLQCVAVCCNVLQCDAVCCSVLQCVAVCCTCGCSFFIICDMNESCHRYGWVTCTTAHSCFTATSLTARPYESCKISKGQPHRCALWELVTNWYKTFLPDHIDLVEMKKPTGLSNDTSTAWFCTEDQILEHLILRTTFENLHWMLSKTIFRNLDTRKGTYIIDWVGRWMRRLCEHNSCIRDDSFTSDMAHTCVPWLIHN